MNEVLRLLGGEPRKVILPAVRYLLSYPDAQPYLADALEEAGHPDADELRAAKGLCAWVALLKRGCYRSLALVKHCRGLISRRASAIAYGRRIGLTAPEGTWLPGDWAPSEREFVPDLCCPGDGGNWPISTATPPPHYFHVSHVRRLVLVGLSGGDVPPDIVTGQEALRETIRLRILAGGF